MSAALLGHPARAGRDFDGNDYVLGGLGRDVLDHWDGRAGRRCHAPDGFDVDLRREVDRWDDQADVEVPHLEGLRIACRTCGSYRSWYDLRPDRVVEGRDTGTSGVLPWHKHEGVRVGKLLLSPDDGGAAGWDVVHTWLAIMDGSVVGACSSTFTARGALRFSWSLLGSDKDALGGDPQRHAGHGLKSLRAAGLRLLRLLHHLQEL